MIASSPTRWVISVLALVLVFYSAFFSLFYQSDLVAADSDAKEYVLLGQNIFSHHEFSRTPGVGEPEVFRTPGYPLVVGLVLQIFNSLTALVWIQIGLVILSVWLISLIGREWGYPKVGVIAGALYAFDPTTIANTFLALSEITFVTTFLASIYLLIFKNKFSLWSLGGGSLLLGVNILIRPVGLYILPLILLFTLFFHYHHLKGRIFPAAVVTIVGLMIVLGPWLMRNYFLTGEVKLSSVGEYNLLFYNTSLFKAERLGISHQIVQDEYRALFPAASTYDYQSFKFSREYKKLAQVEILSAPVSYVSYHLFKTMPFFVGSGFDNYRYLISDQVVPDVNLSDLLLRREGGEFLKAVLADPLVLVERIIWLGLISLAALSLLVRRHWRLVIFSLVLIGWLAVLTGPVAMPRYHLPVSAFIFLLAGLTVSELREYLKTVKNKGKYA